MNLSPEEIRSIKIDMQELGYGFHPIVRSDLFPAVMKTMREMAERIEHQNERIKQLERWTPA